MPTYAVTLGTLQILSNVPISKEVRQAAVAVVKAEMEKKPFEQDGVKISVRLIEVG